MVILFVYLFVVFVYGIAYKRVTAKMLGAKPARSPYAGGRVIAVHGTGLGEADGYSRC